MNTTNSCNTPKPDMRRLEGHTIDNRYRLTRFLDQGNSRAVLIGNHEIQGQVVGTGTTGDSAWITASHWRIP